MATATLTNTIESRKAPRAYYAILDDANGALTKLNGTLYFLSDARDITTIEPEHLNFLVVLGEVGLAEARQIMDQLHGGYAAICTSREQEVA